MFKGILLLLILLSCICVGRMLSNLRKRRYECLNDLLTAMRVLRLRMLNSMDPIGVLLRKADCELFRKLGNCLWEGSSLYECWLEIRKAETSRGGILLGLENEDLRILDDFFIDLGRSGREEQCELFSGVIARMEDVQIHAKQVYADSTKLYTALGTLVGIGICVLIV